MSDQELLEGIQVQSEVHFAELYRRYFQRIYNFVYARMRNHAETEEVVQETFLAVFRSFENYRGQSSLLSWIYGIAKNTCSFSLVTGWEKSLSITAGRATHSCSVRNSRRYKRILSDTSTSKKNHKCRHTADDRRNLRPRGILWTIER